MAENKIEIKIGRDIKKIGKGDLILDNGACIQVVTQNGAFSGWHYAPLIMSKKLFKDLKTRAFIFVDETETKKANERLKRQELTYYRFDVDRMIRSGGYIAIEE